jgi:hypothetical protein
VKLTKKCSECGGTEIYTSKSKGTVGVELLPRIGGLMAVPLLEIYACGGCGHHQVFVPPLYLKEIKENYEPHQ